MGFVVFRFFLRRFGKFGTFCRNFNFSQKLLCRFLRVLNVVKTHIGHADFVCFFLEKSLEILMRFGIMHFLSSFEINMLKVT